MNYKIKHFDESTGLITVSYETNPSYVLTLLVPIVDNKYITGGDLVEYIKSYEGSNSDYRDVGSASNANEIHALVDSTELRQFYINKRNQLLLESDWSQLPDAPLTKDQKDAYKKYRQELRDLTEMPNFPSNIIFPVLE